MAETRLSPIEEATARYGVACANVVRAEKALEDARAEVNRLWHVLQRREAPTG